MYGPGDFTREQALGEIQSILDRAAQQSPQFGKLADRWKRGGVADDTLFFGPFIWAVYEHDAENALDAARAWIEDLAETIRSTEMDVQVGQPVTKDDG